MRASQVWDISTDHGWQNFEAVRNNMVLAGKRPHAQFSGEKRSVDQNSMIYALYQQIAAQVEDQAIIDIRRECKLRYGVPILRAGNENFAAMYNKAFLRTLDYEEKLQAMDFLPVTSLMTKTQGTEFIDTVIREYTKQGYSLTHPDEAEYG